MSPRLGLWLKAAIEFYKHGAHLALILICIAISRRIPLPDFQ
jgi:hypothetical protein